MELTSTESNLNAVVCKNNTFSNKPLIPSIIVDLTSSTTFAPPNAAIVDVDFRHYLSSIYVAGDRLIRNCRIRKDYAMRAVISPITSRSTGKSTILIT